MVLGEEESVLFKDRGVLISGVSFHCTYLNRVGGLCDYQVTYTLCIHVHRIGGSCDYQVTVM